MTIAANEQQLWFLPLGGTGEIGMNMNLYSHAGQWLMVDCGLTFNAPLNPAMDHEEWVTRHDLVCADPSFIEQRLDRLAGIVITHAHEDHVGAVPYLWARLRKPIYTTKFTAEVLRRKLHDAELLDEVTIIEVDLDARFNIGEFDCQWVSMSHSIPEPQALLIRTAAGSVFHTADWKLDSRPIIGTASNLDKLKQLGSLAIQAMVCDSTNALKHGFSVSESACEVGLYHYINSAPKRVIVSCFGSNVARLITLARIASRTGRYMALYGRSLKNMVHIAKRTGYWPDDCKIIDHRHTAYLPKHEILAVATGSQGESRAALARMAQQSHPDVEIAKGDTVIFSTIVIPGNEKAVTRLVENLDALGAEVIQAHQAQLPIHASGHPNEEELKTLYRIIQPNVAVPTHGEKEHLRRHGKIAQLTGIKHQLIGTNGDLYQLSEPIMIKRQYTTTKRIKVARK